MKIFSLLAFSFIALLGITNCKSSHQTLTEKQEAELLQKKAACRLLLVYTEETDKTHLIKIAQKAGGVIHKNYTNMKIISFDFKSERKADKALEKFKKVTGVKSVEKDRIIKIY